MPAVKLGRDNTSKNLSVSSKTTLTKRMREPLGEQMKGTIAICKRLGITREEFLDSFDY
jgi:hypothetical protein